MDQKTERKLRRVMETLNGFIADATISLELNRYNATKELPGDPVLMQAATRRSQLEIVRSELIGVFPSLESVPKPDTSAFLGKKPSS